ncbi:MAG: hypothetical protein K2M95_07520 [Clostridiales bacterium]|nr:hypothetical protein [Clostridiales bacterium]
MDKEIVINYIRQKRGAEIATLQREYGITYREAKSIVDELVHKGCLAYEAGIHYVWVDKEDSASLDKPWKVEGRRLYFSPKTESASDQREEAAASNNAARAKNERIEEIRYDALYHCIKKGTASPALLQCAFSINFAQAWQLIEWMQYNGYITSQEKSACYRINVTEEQFNEIIKRMAQPSSNIMTDSEKLLVRVISAGNVSNENAVATFLAILERRRDVTNVKVPSHALWAEEVEFNKAVVNQIVALIRSDFNMVRKTAIQKAGVHFATVKNACDLRMAQVYERILYTLKGMSDIQYDQIRDCIK